MTKIDTNYSNFNNYSFDIGDTRFKVSLDYSFKESKNVDFSNEVKSDRFIHFHSTNELFFAPQTSVFVKTAEKEYIFSKCFFNVVPLFNHYTIRLKNSYRLLFSMAKKNKSKFSCYKEFNLFFSQNLATRKISKKIIDQLSYISNTSFANDFIATESIISSLKIIFMEIYATYVSKNKQKSNKTNESYVFQIEQVLSEKYNENINLAYLQRILFLSSKQVSRIIFKNYKCSLNKLLKKKRLQIASSLLTETDLTISEIILKVNFKSPNYFYVCFKEEFGISPVEYREKHKN